MRKPGKLPPHFEHTPEEMPTMMLLNDVSKLFRDKLREYSDKLGIPHGYRHILFSLKNEDGKTQYEISQLTHLKAPTVSVALQKMENDGLVKRVTDESDLRQSRVYLTEKGRRTHELLESNLVTCEKNTLATLSAEDEEILRKLLLKMRNNLTENTNK